MFQSQVACFKSFFRETFWGNGGEKGREVSPFSSKFSCLKRNALGIVEKIYYFVQRHYIHVFDFVYIVFDAQALLKNQKVALLVVLRGAFLGGIGTLVFNEIWYFLKMKVSFLFY